MVAMYATPSDGPGVLTVFDVPELTSVAAMVGVLVASGAFQNARFTRLLTHEEWRALLALLDRQAVADDRPLGDPRTSSA